MATKKRTKTKTPRIDVEIRLPLHVIEYYKSLSTLSGVDIQTVFNVGLAAYALSHGLPPMGKSGDGK